MLGPGSPAVARRSAKSVGASPASLYIYVENVDKVVEKATKLGATPQGPVMDMFWGDRCGTVVDPDGYNWMVGIHTMLFRAPRECNACDSPVVHWDCSKLKQCMWSRTSIRVLRRPCSSFTHSSSCGWSSGPCSPDRVPFFAGCISLH